MSWYFGNGSGVVEVPETVERFEGALQIVGLVQAVDLL